MSKVTVLGSGGWGMALAMSAFDKGCDVTFWSPFKEEVENLKSTRTNEKLLKGIYLPEGINITDDLSVVEGDTITIIAVPSTAVRSVARQLKQYKNFGIIVNVSKGFEKESLKRLSEVVSEEFPEAPIVTCMSDHSRNNRFGRKLGQGVSVEDALEQVGTVEGYYAAEMAHKLSLKYGIELPIISECYAVLYEGKDIKQALSNLMQRPGRSEH